MKNWLIGGGILLLVLLFTVFPYNTMVKKDQNVQSQWGNVEVQYQRRMDLIPNLVATVQGYANFEKSTLTQITELRSQVGQSKVKWDQGASIDDKVKAANEMESALSRLLVVFERYPDLKANQNFLDLQTQLEGTENRVSTERKRFNDVVNDYNAYIKKFPNNLT
jgi:LemA protein